MIYVCRAREIPKNPEAFAKGLEKIFGAGASVFEKLIVKSLCSKLGLKYEDVEGRPFADYVKYVKEVDDAKEARENDSSSNSSSNQRSPEAKSFQQSSLLCMETEMGNPAHFYR